jgi:hypothetical protein
MGNRASYDSMIYLTNPGFTGGPHALRKFPMRLQAELSSFQYIFGSRAREDN